MEISRHIQSAYSAPAEAAQTGKTEAAITETTALPSKNSAAATTPASKTEPRLEDLQEAMRALPEIDLDQVATIKRALARGELSSDVKVLAHSILAYHRGSDV